MNALTSFLVFCTIMYTIAGVVVTVTHSPPWTYLSVSCHDCTQITINNILLVDNILTIPYLDPGQKIVDISFIQDNIQMNEKIQYIIPYACSSQPDCTFCFDMFTYSRCTSSAIYWITNVLCLLIILQMIYWTLLIMKPLLQVVIISGKGIKRSSLAFIALASSTLYTATACTSDIDVIIPTVITQLSPTSVTYDTTGSCVMTGWMNVMTGNVVTVILCTDVFTYNIQFVPIYNFSTNTKQSPSYRARNTDGGAPPDVSPHWIGRTDPVAETLNEISKNFGHTSNGHQGACEDDGLLDSSSSVTVQGWALAYQDDIMHKYHTISVHSGSALNNDTFVLSDCFEYDEIVGVTRLITVTDGSTDISFTYSAPADTSELGKIEYLRSVSLIASGNQPDEDTSWGSVGSLYAGPVADSSTNSHLPGCRTQSLFQFTRTAMNCNNLVQMGVIAPFLRGAMASDSSCTNNVNWDTVNYGDNPENFFPLRDKASFLVASGNTFYNTGSFTTDERNYLNQVGCGCSMIEGDDPINKRSKCLSSTFMGIVCTYYQALQVNLVNASQCIAYSSLYGDLSGESTTPVAPSVSFGCSDTVDFEKDYRANQDTSTFIDCQINGLLNAAINLLVLFEQSDYDYFLNNSTMISPNPTNDVVSCLATCYIHNSVYLYGATYRADFTKMVWDNSCLLSNNVYNIYGTPVCTLKPMWKWPYGELSETSFFPETLLTSSSAPLNARGSGCDADGADGRADYIQFVDLNKNELTDIDADLPDLSFTLVNDNIEVVFEPWTPDVIITTLSVNDQKYVYHYVSPPAVPCVTLLWCGNTTGTSDTGARVVILTNQTSASYVFIQKLETPLYNIDPVYPDYITNDGLTTIHVDMYVISASITFTTVPQGFCKTSSVTCTVTITEVLVGDDGLILNENIPGGTVCSWYDISCMGFSFTNPFMIMFIVIIIFVLLGLLIIPCILSCTQSGVSKMGKKS